MAVSASLIRCAVRCFPGHCLSKSFVPWAASLAVCRYCARLAFAFTSDLEAKKRTMNGRWACKPAPESLQNQ